MEEIKKLTDSAEDVIDLLDIVEQVGPERTSVNTQAVKSTGKSAETDCTGTVDLPAPVTVVAEESAERETEQAEPEPVGTAGDASSAEAVVLPGLSESAVLNPDAVDELQGPNDLTTLEEEDIFSVAEMTEKTVEIRLTELEEAGRRYKDSLETLSQQFAGVGSLFLGDAAVRLAIEDMVSRMLDMRLSDNRNTDISPGPQVEGVIARLDALEKRVADLESGCDRQAAAAAARVIREEIAAMRAEVAQNT